MIFHQRTRERSRVLHNIFNKIQNYVELKRKICYNDLIIPKGGDLYGKTRFSALDVFLPLFGFAFFGILLNPARRRARRRGRDGALFRRFDFNAEHGRAHRDRELFRGSVSLPDGRRRN